MSPRQAGNRSAWVPTARGTTPEPHTGPSGGDAGPDAANVQARTCSASALGGIRTPNLFWSIGPASAAECVRVPVRPASGCEQCRTVPSAAAAYPGARAHPRHTPRSGSPRTQVIATATAAAPHEHPLADPGGVGPRTIQLTSAHAAIGVVTIWRDGRTVGVWLGLKKTCRRRRLRRRSMCYGWPPRRTSPGTTVPRGRTARPIFGSSSAGAPSAVYRRWRPGGSTLSCMRAGPKRSAGSARPPSRGVCPWSPASITRA